MEYLSWSLSEERQKYEAQRLRNSLVAIRLGFLIGGHALYFAFCAAANYFGQIQNFSQATSVGFWSMFFIGLALLILELLYARMIPAHVLRYTVRKSGITQYGADGPVAHFDWQRKRHLRIEGDAKKPECRSLILCEMRRFKWMREVARVRIPMPYPGGAVGEIEIVNALHDATQDAGLTWTALEDGTIVVT